MAKQGLQTQAFTIIEVLIVLAVTSILLVAAITVISGQQRKTEFSQAARDLESQINDVINDVTTGVYPNTANFSCSAGPTGPIIGDTGNQQGANQGCIFIGRAIQFGVNSNAERFNVYTVVGLQQKDGQNVTSLADAVPTTLQNNIEDKTTQYGLSIKRMTYKATPSSPAVNVGALGFFSTFESSADLATGTPNVDVIPITGTSINADTSSVILQINAINSDNKNPTGGFELCFDTGGGQHATITVGGNNRQLTTNLVIDNGNCEVPNES